jgi:hypothetical protein
LRCHQPAQRKQSLLETDQEQAKAYDHKQESNDDVFAVRHWTADYETLKCKQEYYDWQYVYGAAGDECQAVGDQFHYAIIP